MPADGFSPEVKQYRILIKDKGSGWWKVKRLIYAQTPAEAVEAFVEYEMPNPPNEVAVQSTARTTNGIFKIFRVKPRASFEIEGI